MNLILISGNAQAAISKKLSDIKKDFEALSITEALGNASIDFSSGSLFSEKRLIIFENPDIKVLEKILQNNDENLTAVFKFSKALEKSSPILKKAQEGKAEILIFDESRETSVFPLLDMLGMKNPKAYLEFEKNYKEFGGQYILTMLAYFLRRMVVKPKPGSDFMRQKIESQKKNFNLKKIQDLYKEIIETDFKIKQGLSEEKIGVTMLVQKILS